MTDAQMLQNLLSVYEALITVRHLREAFATLKEVIAELRRRIELEEVK